MAVLKTVIPKGVEASGIVITGADGRASISFPKAYPTKPNLQLTPELDPATETVFAQKVADETDVAGNYIGAVVQTTSDAGKAIASVPVHWLIVP